MKAFISYSHEDDWALDRLRTHLAMLTHEGKIDAWFDRKILAGEELDQRISEQLKCCELFLPLISPDFFASNYCYETEMMYALERHDASEMRVVPIIIEPCEWTKSPLGRLKALPRDGKPIVEWPNQNAAFLDVAQELRRILTKDEVTAPTTIPRPTDKSTLKIHRYRVKKDFDKIDLSNFRDEAFDEIRAYFQSAITELNDIEGLRGRFVDTKSRTFTCTVINRAMEQGTAHITVHAHGYIGMGDIYYSFSENAPANTANGGFSIKSDEYQLFLVHGRFAASDNDERLSPHEAAQILWSEFLEPAGVSYD